MIETNILQDSFKRNHTYLRISLIERCNLRCSYCMPQEGLLLSPKTNLMSCEEIYEIARHFVNNGVTKIRLTGGEPLIRKDFSEILKKLASLSIELSITTNAIIIDKFINVLKENNVQKVNVSLDSLDAKKFEQITGRAYFKKVYKNILQLIDEGFKVKLNVVLIKGINDNEIIDFINLTKELNICIRFIEFMPFDGNQWSIDKLVSLDTIVKTSEIHFSSKNVIKIEDESNDTSKNYRVKNHKGTFAVISSITNPFCDSCNRIRLTANGQLKNCLFSKSETDLLSHLREGKDISSIIQKSLSEKHRMRGGMNTLQKIQDKVAHSSNRSMIAIGG